MVCVSDPRARIDLSIGAMGGGRGNENAGHKWNQ